MRKIKIKILEQFTEEYIDDLNVRMTHHSNAIEGNTLTLNETATIILDDTIPNAMSKREFLEVLNHSDTLKFLLAELQNNEVDIYMIKEINKILLNRLNHNAGNFKTDYNYIRGANFETASPSETPSEPLTTNTLRVHVSRLTPQRVLEPLVF